MKGFLGRGLGLVALTLALTLPATADQVYVRNHPFKGSVLGTGTNLAEVEVELSSMVDALGLTMWTAKGNTFVAESRSSSTTAPSTPGHLLVNGKERLKVHEQGSIRYVNLTELANATGAHVEYNTATGMVDVDLVAKPQAGLQSSAAGYRLISFLSRTSAPCNEFRPVLGQLEANLHIPVIYIDTEATRSHDYLVNIKYFQGSEIPYTVLLDSGNHPLKRWTGAIPAATLEQDTLKALK